MSNLCVPRCPVFVFPNVWFFALRNTNPASVAAGGQTTITASLKDSSGNTCLNIETGSVSFSDGINKRTGEVVRR